MSTCNEVLMVLEYAEHDLQGVHQRVKDGPGRVFRIADVKTYMAQLMRGLSAMHHKGILHRDLKSANLLITREGVLKIADFGLSRQTVRAGQQGGELTPQVCTLWYRPPELLLAGCGASAAVSCFWGPCAHLDTPPATVRPRLQALAAALRPRHRHLERGLHLCGAARRLAHLRQRHGGGRAVRHLQDVRLARPCRLARGHGASGLGGVPQGVSAEQAAHRPAAQDQRPAAGARPLVDTL